MKNKIIGGLAVVAILISIGFQSKFFEIAKQIDIYTTMFKELNMYYIDEINPGELTEKSINHMLQSLDPYTRFYDEQGVEDARIRSTGVYGGIGAVSRYFDKTLTIREILKNSPAEKSGIKPGDKILKIDETLVSDYNGESITALLNGLPDTKVNLQIERQNKKIEVEVTRKKIEISPVPHYAMLDAEIGYISFTKFNEKAGAEVKKAYLELKDEGMKKLIIDVRSNPGGLLNEAVKITNYFIPKDKIVVTTKAKTKQWSDTFKTRNEPIDIEIPIVILINNRSASASEILSGSLQDYDRAVVIGERSFGKGLVQRYRELTYGTQMKLTISKYYTPSGRCIQELDYTNRDGEKIPKFSDYGREEYTTEGGRKVLGGGGVTPDVVIDKAETTKTTELLFQSDAFFNYATNYMYNHKTIAKPNAFNLKDSDFNEFKKYLEIHQNDFKTNSEKKFEAALKKAEEENLGVSLKTNYKQLLESIQKDKIQEITKNKEEILSKLTEEIVKRYYYAEGVYQQKVMFDKTIINAKEVLNNSKEYNKILGK
ncbi:S41 family peptidase [Lutibacter sp. TH_r2]|uniref:S41 family peptidase n=1 Tax=Lutibacter sp. TH_r2 TaxID=3082083 RepID=UPI002954A9AD|nr:S41 family peptidase [Lutibacter sp. TH_r2]MDV7186504.1 S41 family peptidase [Lutibacter sp. TH_r2]